MIRDRDELDEIIAFLKSSENMPPVEALYIGLKGSLKPQVTSHFCHLHMYKITLCNIYELKSLQILISRKYLIGKMEIQSPFNLGEFLIF